MKKVLTSVLVLSVLVVTACSNLTIAPPPPTPSPIVVANRVTVQGNVIVDLSGRPLLVMGAARPGLDTSCQGDSHYDAATFAAMRNWDINVVQLNVAASYWLDRDRSCTNYRVYIKEAMTNAESAGLSVIINLTSNGPNKPSYPTQDSLDFWSSFLQSFGADPNLLVAPFGGPQDVSWSVWRDGGTLQTPTGNSVDIGMQKLVSEINREVPGLPVIITGPGNGFDLSQISTYPLTGNDLVYGAAITHSASETPQAWQQAFLYLHNQAPVILSSVTDTSACNAQWLNGTIGTARVYLSGVIGGNWIGGSCATSALIQDWNGTPNGYGAAIYGAFVESAVRVIGNNIYDDSGRTLKIYGVGRPGTDYSCAGDGSYSIASFQLMRTWHVNTVRITITAARWLNLNGTCTGYRDLIDSIIKNAEAAGMFVIADLQNERYGTIIPGSDVFPSQQVAVPFWTQFFQAYSSNHYMLAELFGEPQGSGWSIWRNGGYVADSAGGFQAVGMQQLVNIANQYAPNMPVIVNGLNFGYDLSGVGQGYAITGRNIIYGTHPYNYPGKQVQDWGAAFLYLTPHYPVLAGEFGDTSTCSPSYIVPAMNAMRANLVGMMAWAWLPPTNPADYCGFPNLIANWSGAATPYGQYVLTFYNQYAAASGAYLNSSNIF